MSRILLYTDLSPSWPWMFATVHENRALLEQHNVVLAPFQPFSTERIPSHNYCWNRIVADTTPPKPIQSSLDTTAEHLSRGKDVLLMGISHNILAHQSLGRILQQDQRFRGHQVHILLAIGRPLCTLEQRFRSQFKLPSLSDSLAMVRSFASLAKLVLAMQAQWGATAVTLLPDQTSSPVPDRNTVLPSQLFNWLHVPNPQLPRHVPLHHLFMASWEGRRLAWLPEVRLNAWPALDEGIFMDCLAKVERHWDTSPVTPLKYRQMLLREGADNLKMLEALLELPTGGLGHPEALLTEPEVQLALPLPQDRIDALAQALPKNERHVLQQRYANDANLLTPAQKRFAQTLATMDDCYTHIGEIQAKPLLTVLTMTYNQEKYIAQCMDSVLAQKTTFPVQHLVLDHHSQDATPHIVAEYAAKYPSIKPILLSKRAWQANIYGLFARCHTTYVSLCDGDDYFTAPLKLQKQVDYLEKNPDCALCAHPVLVSYEDHDAEDYVYPPEEMLPRGTNAKYTIEDLLQGNLIQTNAVVYRWRFTEGLPSWFRADLIPSDWYWHLLHAEMGKIGFMPEIMSVYRRHRKALYHTTQISVVEHRKTHGMAELATYDAVNSHFRNKYFDGLARLADGVFVNFLETSIEEDDQSLLNNATEKFPLFAKHFLESMEQVSSTQNEK